jgi:hypothetical protein
MAVDEQRLRQSLHARLAEAVGADEAALLMEYLPPVGWADIARQSDLDAQRVLLSRDIASLTTEMTSEFAAIRSELTSEFAAVRSEIRAEIAELKSQLLMWLVPTIIGSVGVAVTLSRVV